MINSRDCCFKFLNRSLPIFPTDHVILKPKEQKLIKVTAPFIDKISGLAMVKILDGGTHSTLLIKLKFTHNAAIIDMVNKWHRNHDISARRNVSNSRFKIVRIL